MKLFIYCAGGLGKEICDLARIINEKEKRWEEIGFIDDVRKEREYYNTKVYRFEEALQAGKKETIEVSIANGEPYHREQIYERIKKASLPLATLIHPNATISPSVKLGEGVILQMDARLSSDVVVKDNVLLQASLIIGHDGVVASHSVISSYSVLGGNCNIGKRAYVAPGSLIKDRITIGDDAIIGIGSVVTRNINAYDIVLGNPARKIGENTEHKVFR